MPTPRDHPKPPAWVLPRRNPHGRPPARHGMCSECREVYKLTLMLDVVTHGPRSNRCPGSRKQPIWVSPMPPEPKLSRRET